MKRSIKLFMYLLNCVLACFLLSSCISLSEKANAKSLQLLENKAISGNIDAQIKLGSEYENGFTLTQSDTEAIRWYRSAAEKGSAEGAYKAALLLLGKGRNSYSVAVELLESAASANYAPAQIALADNILANQTDAQAIQRAHILYLAAAENELAEAQYKVATQFFTGIGIDRDLKAAARWFHKSADQGNALAQLALGNLYLTGLGVPYSVVTAMNWYEQSALQGSFQAQSNQGDLLTLERYGTLRDAEAGAYWYQLSAEQKHAHAQARLGMLYENGSGLQRDMKQAARWYLAAAEQGHASAQCRLGSLYLRGVGLSQNAAEAKRWFELAAAQVPAGVLSLLGFIYYDCEQFDIHEIELPVPESFNS